MERMKDVAAQVLTDEHAWLEGGQEYVVCAFYTPDYLDHVLQLKRSLEVLSINHFLKRYEATESWEIATRIKSAFVEHCLATLQPRHVLYVDADAAVHQSPRLLDAITTDLAVKVELIDNRRVRVVPGTLYVRNTPAAQRFVAAWRAAGVSCAALATDGDLLHRALDRTEGLTLTLLPETYAIVTGESSVAPVIEHFRVSRELVKLRRTKRRMRRALAVASVFLSVTAAWFVAAAVAQ